MNVLDLFSGIGGFSLGLERAGMRTVAFCEVDAKARKVLAKHWPTVPIFSDVRELDRATLDLLTDADEIDVICGGFPCQDISIAGTGAGLAGKRSGLWSEYARLIGEIKPAFALIENVSALRARGLEQVLGALAALGYDAEWHCIPAQAVSAPHLRDRVWIIAYAHDAGRDEQRRPGAKLAQFVESQRAHGWAVEPDICRVVNGFPGRVDRLRQLGNAVIPQIPEAIGRALMAAV